MYLRKLIFLYINPIVSAQDLPTFDNWNVRSIIGLGDFSECIPSGRNSIRRYLSTSLVNFLTWDEVLYVGAHTESDRGFNILVQNFPIKL